MKKFIAGLSVGLLLSVVVSVYADTPAVIGVVIDRIKVVVNGQSLDKATILYKSETYVPLRALSEMLDFELIWDEQTYTARVNTTEQFEAVTPREIEYINKIFAAFEEVQFVLDDIYETVHGEASPYDSEELMQQAVSMFNEVKAITAPDSLSEYKAAVDKFCGLNINIFSDLLFYIASNRGTVGDFTEVFDSKYDAEFLKSAYVEVEDILFKFLEQRMVQ